jgi:endonuclease YncB( thermonuclease family)
MKLGDKTLIIDPPSGWRYGFPRPAPENFFEDGFDLGAWLISCGYPAADVKLAIKHGRYWEVSNEQG